MRRFVCGALLLYAVVWAAMTYPQVRHLSAGVNDVGDPLLNTWALAWVAHQLPFAPAHVFDANILYPERRTLAYSETLLAPAIVGPSCSVSCWAARWRRPRPSLTCARMPWLANAPAPMCRTAPRGGPALPRHLPAT